ncbi:MAG: indolepyruvate ferredoxin oxidoreductase, beta subunit [Verrucomicrobiota bacterium]|jgi:indolepyruvate ferredoxin oxidoreductase beta subunit|nr:indolepyruvate ferredoxin oxidoreductase, beta subunit [Verrucomicrobiota bacterium]MDK2962646.1 indolepyruvate ferredoxin oxidoreductase, beta subunit [Verrucomicrobiota bacterium]
MNEKVTSIKVAGLGGMGVLKSSLILAEVFFRQGLDVKKAEVHGMSQRGGSICSDVRFGKKVFSPMIPAGTIDFLVLFQEDQFPLYEAECSPDTVILKPTAIDLSRLGNRKALNVAMIGLLSRHLDVPVDAWLKVIREILPQKLHEVNEAAFELGRLSA